MLWCMHGRRDLRERRDQSLGLAQVSWQATPHSSTAATDDSLSLRSQGPGARCPLTQRCPWTSPSPKPPVRAPSH